MKEQRKNDEPKKSAAREILEYILTLLGTAAVILLLNTFVFINARIPSESMQNTVMAGDRIFGNRLAYLNASPERFDIVIFPAPDDPSKLYIKRIIGLPGETLLVRDGKVYVDGSDEPLDDSFCPEAPEGDFGPYEIPEGCFFMMGDNRNHSLDARFWEHTYVREEAILGKAGFRYWPLTRMGRVS